MADTNGAFLAAAQRVYKNHYKNGTDPRTSKWLQRLAQSPEAKNPAFQRWAGMAQYGNG